MVLLNRGWYLCHNCVTNEMRRSLEGGVNNKAALITGRRSLEEIP